MASNQQQSLNDDFLEQILAIPSYGGNETGLAGNDGNLAGTAASMVLQLSSGDGSGHVPGGGFQGSVFPLELSLEQGKSGFLKPQDASGSGKRFRDDIDGKTPGKNPFHGQPSQVMPHPPSIRPRVRARRGQATDPHSIAERLRRERIAERMKALQELVPSSNKVLSMSRLGGTGAVAQLVSDIPLPSVEGEASEGGNNQQAWEKWSTDGTERQVAKLMEEDVGTAMQFLQSKELCMMPISLAATIYRTRQPDASSLLKPEPNTPS
ncbi:hypothetical protein HHK36_026833 [Tetracentron sinense]|uniref:BHLH domain-containing protein n=1 Tax=Tetracentron sinense TaxID=13715 RepID=A0A834YG94_TETSI|nr:hypothetical protein HHK36_026833 [Tetracentron sinense]